MANAGNNNRLWIFAQKIYLKEEGLVVRAKPMILHKKDKGWKVSGSLPKCKLSRHDGAKFVYLLVTFLIKMKLPVYMKRLIVGME